MTDQSNQSMSALLSQVATVVSMSSTAIGMTRRDKNAAALAERDHNAAAGISAVNVSRFAGCEHRIKEINSQVALAREALLSNTTAWGERRLLANENMERMLRAWAPPKTEHSRLVQQLIEDAPALINTARGNLGSFDIPLPTVEEISEAFSLEFKMEPVPDASQWHSSSLDTAVENELRRRFEADIASAYQQAQQDALQRLADPLKNLVDRMDKYQEREDLKAKGFDAKGGYFRDSIIDNVNEIATVFGSFNLLKDPALDALAKQLEVFRGVDAESLRKHEDQRKATKAQAQAILDQLGDWIR